MPEQSLLILLILSLRSHQGNMAQAMAADSMDAAVMDADAIMESVYFRDMQIKPREELYVTLLLFSFRAVLFVLNLQKLKLLILIQM